MTRSALSSNTKFVLRGYDNNDYFKALYNHLKRRARKLLVDTINRVSEQMNSAVVRDLLFILSDLDRESIAVVIKRVEQAITTTNATSSNTPHEQAMVIEWVRVNHIALEFLVKLQLINKSSRAARVRRSRTSNT
jgi:hypothetical protein